MKVKLRNKPLDSVLFSSSLVIGSLIALECFMVLNKKGSSSALIGVLASVICVAFLKIGQFIISYMVQHKRMTIDEENYPVELVIGENGVNAKLCPVEVSTNMVMLRDGVESKCMTDSLRHGVYLKEYMDSHFKIERQSNGDRIYYKSDDDGRKNLFVFNKEENKIYPADGEERRLILEGYEFGKAKEIKGFEYIGCLLKDLTPIAISR